jgi:hypothetical protein
MKNVHLLIKFDKYATASQLTRSAAVREAVKTWIRQTEIKKFEDTWIEKLKDNPEDLGDSEAWSKAEKWGDE